MRSEDPWRACLERISDDKTSPVISHELMRSSYAQLLTAADEEQGHRRPPRFDHPRMSYLTPSDYEWILDYLDEA